MPRFHVVSNLDPPAPPLYQVVDTSKLPPQAVVMRGFRSWFNKLDAHLVAAELNVDPDAEYQYDGPVRQDGQEEVI